MLFRWSDGTLCFVGVEVSKAGRVVVGVGKARQAVTPLRCIRVRLLLPVNAHMALRTHPTNHMPRKRVM